MATTQQLVNTALVIYFAYVDGESDRCYVKRAQREGFFELNGLEFSLEQLRDMARRLQFVLKDGDRVVLETVETFDGSEGYMRLLFQGPPTFL